MENVNFRNVDQYIVYACISFYSRVVLKKLNDGQLSEFRKVEKLLKSNVKTKADIKYLKEIV